MSDALFLTNTRITTTTPSYLRPKCEGDICLMEAILSLDLPTKTIQALNCCRIYIRAIYLSDIVNPQGKQIVREFLDCARCISSKLHWPRQIHLITKERKLWKKILVQLFVSLPTFMTLGSYLGTWSGDPNVHHQCYNEGIARMCEHWYVCNCHRWYYHSIEQVHRHYVIVSDERF